jgi:hypothetical protein
MKKIDKFTPRDELKNYKEFWNVEEMKEINRRFLNAICHNSIKLKMNISEFHYFDPFSILIQ